MPHLGIVDIFRLSSIGHVAKLLFHKRRVARWYEAFRDQSVPNPNRHLPPVACPTCSFAPPRRRPGWLGSAFPKGLVGAIDPEREDRCAWADRLGRRGEFAVQTHR